MYSNDDRARYEHNGIIKWIDGVLDGMLHQNYVAQVEEELHGVPKEPDKQGTSWMADDGLEPSA